MSTNKGNDVGVLSLKMNSIADGQIMIMKSG